MITAKNSFLETGFGL